MDARQKLESAADGLLFLSESESPFRFVELPEGVRGFDADSAATLAALGEPADAPVSSRSLDDLLAGHVEEADPHDPIAQENVPRFRALKDALRSTLSDVRVWRVGDVNVRYYVLGRTTDGRIAGLVTEALET